jgi:hypothetical protein
MTARDWVRFWGKAHLNARWSVVYVETNINASSLNSQGGDLAANITRSDNGNSSAKGGSLLSAQRQPIEPIATEVRLVPRHEFSFANAAGEVRRIAGSNELPFVRETPSTLRRFTPTLGR